MEFTIELRRLLSICPTVAKTVRPSPIPITTGPTGSDRLEIALIAALKAIRPFKRLLLTTCFKKN